MSIIHQTDSTESSASLEASAPQVVLRLVDLHKSFPGRDRQAVHALAGVSFEVNQREIVGLVGPDGAGKTTLMRIAACLLEPEQGQAIVVGRDSIRDTLAIQDRISYMPQKFGLYQDLTCQENLDLYADLQGVPKRERPDRYARLLEMTGLEQFAKRLAGRLSGGMKQKLGLACALVKSPELLLLDEPTVGVDPVSRRELWRIVNEMVEQEQIGVLVATAYLDEAEQCRRVVVLHEGQKLDEGPPAYFREQAKSHSFVVQPPSHTRPRVLQARLIARPGIADATLRSGKVRVVTEQANPDAIQAALPSELVQQITPVAPTFEDAFMKRLFEVKTADHELDTRVQAIPAYQDDQPQHDDKPGNKDAAEPMVFTRDLTKKFGSFTAVSNISFDVQRGEIFGLLGPNGAGKSTTFRMLCGLSKVTAGQVRVAGHDLRKSGSVARQRLGYMAQQFSLYGQLSVLENLRFFGRAYGLNRKQLKERLAWAVDEFHLLEHQNDPAGDLPLGFKQRLSMAAALLHQPDILFLDEPTSGVDPITRRDFWRRISAFANAGVTVIVTTHFMEEAEYCDRMLIMSQGKELASGTPEHIRSLARSEKLPDPTIEDAFIALAQGHVTDGRSVLEAAP